MPKRTPQIRQTVDGSCTHQRALKRRSAGCRPALLPSCSLKEGMILNLCIRDCRVIRLGPNRAAAPSVPRPWVRQCVRYSGTLSRLKITTGGPAYGPLTVALWREVTREHANAFTARPQQRNIQDDRSRFRIRTKVPLSSKRTSSISARMRQIPRPCFSSN